MLYSSALGVVHAGFVFAAAVLLILTLVLALELAATALLPARGASGSERRASSYVVVMPAHNEAAVIKGTLAGVLADLTESGRVLVVADNCTDATAAIARDCGVQVIERIDPARRGKGYALAHAVRFMGADPPAVVIVLDADCQPERGSLALLAATAEHRNCPVQGRYELIAPGENAGTLARVGAFAWRIKNSLRPQGLAALGAPCLLMGTGMAFPWRVLSPSHLDTGHLVEDMVLGLELAAEGQYPVFFPQACVRSAIPPSVEGQKSQRARWETGHLQVIRTWVPRLMARSLAKRDWRLALLALHTAVPPLALLVLLLVLVTAGSTIVALAGGPAFALATALVAVAVAGGVFCTYWLRSGRDVLTPGELVLLPGYILSKVPLYVHAAAGKSLEWVRSKRD